MRMAKIPYMITGALASGYYGLPRSTVDLDVVVRLEESDINRLVEAAQKTSFEINKHGALAGMRIENRIVMRSPKAYRIDLWLLRSKYDEMAFARRRRVRIFGESAYICSPEDLVLQKLRVGRVQDEDDIVGVLIRQAGKLNKKYLTSWAPSLGVEQVLERVIARAKRGE